MNDIVLLVILIVVSIIGSIIKSSNKKGATQPHKEVTTPWDDDTVQDFEQQTEFSQRQTQADNTVSDNAYTIKQSPKSGDINNTSFDVIDEIVDNFDIKAAVIYSEIMKPKFKEL